MESLHRAVGLVAIAAGSLLLAVHFYSSAGPSARIPSTALGILLLLLSLLLAYAGARKSCQKASLFVSLCLTVSVLWCGYGVIQILTGQGVLLGAADLRNAAVPGLVACGLGLLLISLMGFLQKEVPLALIASAISLACAHEVASFYDAAFGSAAVACNYMAVCFVGGYLGLGKCLFALSQEKIALPGADLAKKEAGNRQCPGGGTGSNDLTAFSLILNMLSASVLGCRLLGVTDELFVGQVPWLWAGGIYQLGASIFSYRSLDALAATFLGFTSLLKFGEGYSLLTLRWVAEEPSFPVPFSVAFAVLLTTLALFIAIDSLADGLYLLFYVALSLALACSPKGFLEGGPQGVAVAIFMASGLLTLLHLYNGNARVKMPRGERVLKALISHLHPCELRKGNDLHTPYLGYSKYADAEALGYACSVLASFAITVTAKPSTPLPTVVLPGVVAAGGLLKLLCGCVAFSRGKTLESSAFIVYGFMWIIWGIARYGGLYDAARGFQVAVGIVSLMLFNAFLVLCTLFLSISWFLYSLSFELILISFMLDAVGATSMGYDSTVTIIFGLVSFYCFLSTLVNCTFESPQLPMGRPLVRLRGFEGGNTKCLHLPARKASSIKQVAEIMKRGGICGIPTDTVYVLAAACCQPDAVEKAYNTKHQAQDRPMSLWISSLKQLEPAKHLFSPVLWDFMDAAWPSPISLVIPRGEWVAHLGMNNSAKYVGTPQSIAIRIPDCSVTTYLIDLVGPITVTSANPTGEADTTHHNQVYARLGNKVDAILCDGPSPENVASTVVDCTKIGNGHIGFFRVGLVPKSQVLQILEQVQRRYQPGHTSNLLSMEGKEEQQTPCSASVRNNAHVQGNSPALCASKAFNPDEGDAPP
ncbi:uncharacterized protein LOC143822807 isoform X2 [Paroedura picta]|uniref:uncharacterized protein LOC143822807 isoform X2 n=1 Tax=Paroedura picta TaxID=143630 RepID=UPI004056A91E